MQVFHTNITRADEFPMLLFPLITPVLHDTTLMHLCSLRSLEIDPTLVNILYSRVVRILATSYRVIARNLTNVHLSLFCLIGIITINPSYRNYKI